MFGKLFGKGRSESENSGREIPWIALETPGQLEEIRENSLNRFQMIFKHSNTCGISSMAFKMLLPNLIPLEDQADFLFLDIQRHREISDALASEYGQRHESPQLLVIRNGTVVHASSHGRIADFDSGELPV